MKRFRFRLDPFLRYKEFLERKAQQDMAGAQKDVTDCEKNIEQSRKHLYETIDALEKEMSEGIGSERYQFFSTYIAGIETFIESESKRLLKLLKILEQKRRALAQKAKEKKAIGNLKERRKEAYYDAMFKVIQKETDDTVIVRKAREIQQ